MAKPGSHTRPFQASSQLRGAPARSYVVAGEKARTCSAASDKAELHHAAPAGACGYWGKGQMWPRMSRWNVLTGTSRRPEKLPFPVTASQFASFLR